MTRASWTGMVVAVVTAGLLLPASRTEAGPCGCACPWAGVYPTVVLPWNCDCTVDEASLEAQLRYQIAGGVSGVLMLGSIGEGEAASWAAREQALRTAVRVTTGRVPVIAGIHTCDVETAKAQMLQARDIGAAAVLVKYKGNPKASACQVLGFYQCLSELAILPIFYYHYPSDTGLKLTPDQLADIVRLPGVVGAKMSTLDPREFEALVSKTRGCGKVFYSGTAMNLTQFLDDGGHGAMCPEAVILPRQTVCAHRLYCEGQAASARDAQKELFVLTPVLQGKLSTERFARTLVMVTQDLELKLPMQEHQPQARLKATLDALCVPTSSRVSCPLPGLSQHDRVLVDSVVAKVRERRLVGGVP